MPQCEYSKVASSMARCETDRLMSLLVLILSCFLLVTLEILKQNTDGTINFKGMLVGNPYAEPFSNLITQIEAFYSHGLISGPLSRVGESLHKHANL